MLPSRTLLIQKFFPSLMIILSSTIFSFSHAQHMFFHLLPGFGTPFTWVGLGADANWTTALNWNTNVVPGAGDRATFDDTCLSNCDPTINVSISVRGVNMKSTYAGTITQGVGNSLTIGTDGWTQEAGIFAGSAAAINMNGPFSQSGGTYTATSGLWTQAANLTKSGGTFNHNNGSWFTSSSMTISANGISMNNVSFAGAGAAQNLSGGTIIVNGTFNLDDPVGGPIGTLNNGTVQVHGDVTTANFGKMGSAVVSFVGTGAQTLTSTSSFIPSVHINKPSGTLSLVGTIKVPHSWTWVAGTVNAGASTLEFGAGNNESGTVNAGPVNYNNVTFGGYGSDHSINAGTMIVLNDLIINDSAMGFAGTLTNGNIEAHGSVTIANYGKVGSAVIKIVGTGVQALNGTSGYTPKIEINKPSGTLTITGTLQTFDGWSHIAGTVDASTSTIIFAGSNNESYSIIPGTMNYNHVTFTGYSVDQNLSAGVMAVNGHLTLSDTDANSGNINNGTMNVAGNVIFSNYGKSGNAVLNFVGNSNATLTIGATSATLSTTHNVAKTGLATSVSLVANTNYSTAGRNFSITSGTLNLAGFTFAVNSLLTISSGGRLLCNGGTATAGSWSMLGEISCGSGQGITWTGAGNDNLWTTAGNWTNNTIPGASDIAIFNNSACVAAQCNAQINSNLSVRGIFLQSTYAGTLTQNATRTLTVGAAGYSQAAGTFAGGDSAVTMNGVFSLSGGTYTATTGTWTQSADMTISGAPTFNHNSGTWTTSVTMTMTPNGITLNNVTFAGGSSSHQNLNGGTLIVNGNLFLNATAIGSQLNLGTIEARGNISFNGVGKGAGSVLIKINGTGAQSLDGTGSTTAYIPAVEIDKSSGTLTLVSTITPIANWTWTAGTVDAGTSTLEFPYTQTIIPGPVIYNNVTFRGGSTSHQNLNNQTMIVNGTLELSATSTASQLNSGTIEARGNITFDNEGKGVGSALIKINGTGAQSMDAAGATNAFIPAVEIDKPSGTLTLVNTIEPIANWTWTAGTVDAGTSTLDFAYTQTITPGPVIYNNVTFRGGSTSHQNLNNQTMIVNGTLLFSSATSSSQLNSGTIEARGNITFGNEGKGVGSALIKINGTGAQSMDGTGATTARIPAVEIDKPSGTLTLIGTISLITNWTWTAGTVDAGTSTLRFTGNTLSIIPGSISYFNVTFTGGTGTQDLNAGTMVVLGTTNFAGTTSGANLNNGTIDARGPVTVTSNGNIGTAVLKMSGTSSSQLTWTAGSLLTTTVTVEKTGGASVVLATNAVFSTAGRDFTITTGTLDLNGFDFNVNDVLTVSVGATLKCNGGELVNPQPVSIVNSGTINCPGYSTYDFNWTGAGGDANFNTAGNWQGGVSPSSTSVVVFQDTYCGANCSANILANTNIKGVRIYSPYTGTLTQNGGVTLTIGTRGYTQAAGTFAGSNSNISINGSLSLTGGAFTSTSGILSVKNNFITSAATFNHNSGSVILGTNGGGATTLNMGANSLNNLTYDQSFSSNTVTGSVNVLGNTVVNGSSMTMVGGTINFFKNLTLATVYGSGSSTLFRAVGSTDQTLSAASGNRVPSLEIASSGGTVFLSGSLGVLNNFTYTSGTVDAGTSTFNFGGNGFGAVNINSGSVNFNNISIGVSFSNTNITGNLNALGNVSITGSSTSTNGGVIYVGGNYSSTVAGTNAVTFNGAGVQTLTVGASKPSGTFTINKSSGSVLLVANTLLNNAGQNLTVTAGTLDMAGFNLTVGNNISNSGTIQRGINPSCGTITQGGSYTGSAAVCP